MVGKSRPYVVKLPALCNLAEVLFQKALRCIDKSFPAYSVRLDSSSPRTYIDLSPTTQLQLHRET